MARIHDLTAQAVARGQITQETADLTIKLHDDYKAGRITASQAARLIADLPVNYPTPEDKARDESTREIILASAKAFEAIEKTAASKDELEERVDTVARATVDTLGIDALIKQFQAAAQASQASQGPGDPAASNEAKAKYIGGRNPYDDADRVNNGPNKEYVRASISSDDAQRTIFDVKYDRPLPDSNNALRVKSGEIWGGAWPLVTPEYLRGLDACEHCQAEFAAKYPYGLSLDPATLTFDNFQDIARITATHGVTDHFRDETDEIVSESEELRADLDETIKTDQGFSERAEAAFVAYHEDARDALIALLPITFAVLEAEYGTDKPIVLGYDEGRTNKARLDRGYISKAYRPEVREAYAQNAPSTSTIQ